MEKLIQALQILLKYGNPTYPTCCEHDVMMVMIDPARVSGEDLATLDLIGFFPEDECFKSYKYGSC